MKKLILVLLTCAIVILPLTGEDETKPNPVPIDKIDSIFQMSDDAVRLKAFDDLALSLGLSRKEAVAVGHGLWNATIKTDPIDDSNDIFITLFPTEKKGFEKKNPGLCISYIDGEIMAYIGWDNYLADNTQVTLRYDKEKALSEKWGKSEDSTATFCPDSSQFIYKLLKHDRLISQIKADNKDLITLIYDLKGLKEILSEYKEFENILKKK